EFLNSCETFLIFFSYQVLSLKFVKFISNIFYFTNLVGRGIWKERDLQVSAYLVILIIPPLIRRLYFC
ncbi:hypothetical protein, partial [Streptococcus pneumoniae]|uniref:hypothetical protein n=1 Tax=Streptococcus pneumoniae TaxID=1313 RepID=UPI00067D02FA